MNKDIRYSGYTTEPSDYECSDGQMAASLNLINEEGQLKPLFQPKAKLRLPSGCSVLFIHKTTQFTHYIIYDSEDSYLYWLNTSVTSITGLGGNQRVGSDQIFNVKHINALGNTLMVFTETGITYALWRDGQYHILGEKLPEIAISFGLQGHPRLYSLVKENDSRNARGLFTINFNSISRSDIYNTFSDANKHKVTEQVMAKVNKFIAEQTTQKGRFCFPFFVRWAYRLYDDELVMHSAPVLMLPSTSAAPIVMWNRATGNNSYDSADCDIMLVAADLDYCLTYHGDHVHIDDWKDIIKSVEVFVSKPIYTYDPNGEVLGFNDEDNFECEFIGRLYNGEKDMKSPDTTFATSVTEDRMLAPFDSTSFMSYYMEYSYSEIYSMYFSANRSHPNATLRMPEFSADKLNENVEDVANFYHLASISLDDLTTYVRKVIDIKDDYLQSLVNREVMTDDYLTHEHLIASFSQAYNSRMNLSGIKRYPFEGFISNALFPHCNSFHSFSRLANNTLSVSTEGLSFNDMTMRIYINENGQHYYVENAPDDYRVLNLRRFVNTGNTTITHKLGSGWSKVIEYNFQNGTRTTTVYDNNNNVVSTETAQDRYKPTAWGSWIFYPNANAYKIAIMQDYNIVYVTDLKPHPFLNGAYAWLGFKSERGGTVPTPPTVVNPNPLVIDAANKIYTSRVDNPFYYPLQGIKSIGSGRMLAIATAHKALSPSQFGQFPLYAFTDECVWSLTPDSEGFFRPAQPITQDVCINADSITQLDSSVLFATDRGIMELKGSRAVCITDNINAQQPFNVLDLPGFAELHAKLGHTDDTCFPTKPFLEYLKGCRMIYDYIHQRVIMFNPTTVTNNGVTTRTYTYAYVYSLKSRMWGMMFTNILSSINSYPDALAMSDGNYIVTFSDTDETISKGLFVTRPLKLDAPDIHKTISTLIQRGHFQIGDVATALYGSRDLFTWVPIWSSKNSRLRGFRGSPYKYFRIVGVTSLTADKSISGASVEYDIRKINHLR